MKYAVYGTVYNEAAVIEESIKSFWSDELEKVVIVDNYSFDGTYEKLLSIKKDYNLEVYRYRCTRGEGRGIALKKIGGGYFTAFVDLDVIYNKNLLKLLELEESVYVPWNLRKFQGTYTARSDDILDKGGWKDLNVGEDVEFSARMGIKKTFPLIIGINTMKAREKEKVKLSNVFRKVRGDIDSIRGVGYSFNEYVKYVNFRKYGKLRIPLYFIAKIRGIYRYSKGMNNLEIVRNKVIETLENPLDYDFSKEYIFLSIEKDVSKKIKEVLGDYYTKNIVKHNIKFWLYSKTQETMNFVINLISQ